MFEMMGVEMGVSVVELELELRAAALSIELEELGPPPMTHQMTAGPWLPGEQCARNMGARKISSLLGRVWVIST
jgi:hypothetical protein